MNRSISALGLAMIMNFEKFEAKTYICPAGLLTIGYGHKLLKNEKYKAITHDIAMDLLKKDLKQAESAVLRNINIPLSDNQFAALVSFTYNVGASALQRSTLRQKINRATNDSLHEEFLKWIYAGSKILKGLIKRRSTEAELFMT